MTDEQCLRALVEENCCAAFAALVERYYRQVFSICYSRLNNRADAEDATQDVFRKLIESSDGIERDLSGWLRSCAVNTSISMIRSASARRRRENALENGTCSCESTEHIDRAELVNRMLDELDQQQRALLIRHVVGGVSQSALAEELGVTQQAVASRIMTIRKRLRSWLDLRHIGTLGLGWLVTGGWSSAKAAAVRAASTLGLPTTGGGVGVVGASAGKSAVATAVTVGVICLLPGDDPHIAMQNSGLSNQGRQARTAMNTQGTSNQAYAVSGGSSVSAGLPGTYDAGPSTRRRSLSNLRAFSLDANLSSRTVTDPFQYNITPIDEPQFLTVHNVPSGAVDMSAPVPTLQLFTVSNRHTLAISTQVQPRQAVEKSSVQYEPRDLPSEFVSVPNHVTTDQQVAEGPVEVAGEDVPGPGDSEVRAWVMATVGKQRWDRFRTVALFVRGGEYPLDRDQARPDEDRSRRDRQPPWKFASAIDPEDVIAAFADVYEPSGEDPELGLSEREFRRIRLSHRDERRNDDESLLADRVRNPRGFELSDDAVALLRDFLPITRLARAYHPRQDPLNTNVLIPAGDGSVTNDTSTAEMFIPVQSISQAFNFADKLEQDIVLPDILDDFQDFADLPADVPPVVASFFTYMPPIEPIEYAQGVEQLALERYRVVSLPEPAGLTLLGIGSLLLLRRS